jgi:hypothetical protein
VGKRKSAGTPASMAFCRGSCDGGDGLAAYSVSESELSLGVTGSCASWPDVPFWAMVVALKLEKLGKSERDGQVAIEQCVDGKWVTLGETAADSWIGLEAVSELP